MSRIVLRVDRVVVDEAALAGRPAHEWAAALEEALAAVVQSGAAPVPMRSARAVLRTAASGPSPSGIADAVAAVVDLAPGPQSRLVAPGAPVGGRSTRGGPR
jgi:hypothetical protein